MTRERVETVIRFMVPCLDLVLAAGERISRVVEPEDYDYYPARPLADRDNENAPPGGQPVQ
jgi:hypothetical protein